MVTPTQTKQSPAGMQSPVARLTTADPAVPRARCAPRGWAGGPGGWRAGLHQDQSSALGPASSEGFWVQFPKAVFILQMPPQTIRKQKATSFEVWQESHAPPPRPPKISFSFIPVFPVQAAFEKTEVGENESQCQILTRQKTNCFSPRPPTPGSGIMGWGAGPLSCC